MRTSEDFSSFFWGTSISKSFISVSFDYSCLKTHINTARKRSKHKYQLQKNRIFTAPCCHTDCRTDDCHCRGKVTFGACISVCVEVFKLLLVLCMNPPACVRLHLLFSGSCQIVASSDALQLHSLPLKGCFPMQPCVWKTAHNVCVHTLLVFDQPRQ